MADNQLELSWQEALKILDRHFDIRSGNRERGPVTYRMEENGARLELRLEDGQLVAALPPAPTSARREDRYKIRAIDNANDLIEIIRQFGLRVDTPPAAPRAQMIKETPHEANSMPLNTILYGPPGTGKTYKTAELAVRICDGVAPSKRDEVMIRYEQLRKEERINFVTFHQSYGYEDFVEGIRPESVDGRINYPVRPGIFRKICDAARRSTIARPGLVGRPLNERNFYKISLGRTGTSEGTQVFKDCIENGRILLGWGDFVDFSDCKTREEIDNRLEAEHPAAEKPESDARYIDVFKHELRTGDIVIVSQGNGAYRAIGEVTGDYEYLEAPAAGRFHQARPVRWLAVFESSHSVEEIYDRNFMQSALYQLDRGGLRFAELERQIQDQTASGSQNFVLIVDEINRANMSKVFGELITLLEPDKRDGEPNALTVRLPYSGDDFSVPSNLYVVATMNTADKSIAVLDTALRRRFEFEELLPDYSALSAQPVGGVDLRALLEALNERIEYLYDRDHMIGHAYLVGVRSLVDLDGVFRRKVLPLLQEYFYEDWAKIRVVLNDQDGLFIERKESLPKGLGNVADDYEVRVRYKVRSEPFPLQAYLNVYR